MTISEIAKMAGVSSAAVSRYLNNGSLSQQKRECIAKVIEETNYQPSEYARTMRTKKTKRIGVIVPQIDSESSPEILSGIGSVMDQMNYHVLLMDSNRCLSKELRMLETFQQSQVDGLILAASVLTEEHIRLLGQMQCPVVIVGQKCEEYSCVYHNDFQASYEMMKYLLKSGNTYPAYIGVNRRDLAAGLNRYLGVKKALEEADIVMETIPCAEADFTIQSGKEAMRRLLMTGRKIDCLFCATDMIAVGAITCLREHGLCVPEDIRISGIGHGLVADILTPQLTTVHFHYRTSGLEAARLILEQIQNPQAEKKSRMLSYRMMFQGTA